MNIFPLQSAHLSAVAALERECFGQPWSEGALATLLAPEAICFVACDEEGRVIGYGGMLTVLDEGQITNIATANTHRRQGVAREILGAMLSEAKARGLKTVSLEVRASNTGAQALYTQKGFRAVGVRRGFYAHPREDGLVMVLTI